MTMHTQPDTKFNELVQQINAFPEDRQITPFELHSFEKEADRLKALDARQAYQIKGMIACLKRDIDAMHKWHRRAIQISNWSDRAAAYESYATSLNRLGFTDELVDQCRAAVDVAPDSKGHLAFLIASLGFTGRLREAIRWLENYRKLSPDEEHDDESILVNQVAPFLATNQLTDADISQILNVARDILIENGQRFYLAEWVLLNDDEDQVLAYSLNVSGVKAHEVARLNEQIAERRAELQETEAAATKIVVMVSKDADDGRDAA